MAAVVRVSHKSFQSELAVVVVVGAGAGANYC